MQRNVLRATLAAAVALGLALTWLILDVELVNSGELTGLFYVGARAVLPPGDLAAHTHRVRDERGYDGEFYYLIAHDPLNRKGFLAYVDSPRYRWRRIGIPALAHLLAFGNDAWIDWVFVALQLGFVFLGSYWLAAFVLQNGGGAGWGVAFLLIPAVAVSLDRMTVDLPVAAFTIAAIYYACREGPDGERQAWPAFAALTFAPLVRETGMLVILAWCIFWAVKKNARNMLLGAACAIPAIGWWIYVALHTTPDVIPFVADIPFGGLVTWTIHAMKEPQAAYGPRANAVLELVALLGVWLAFALTVYVIAQRVRIKSGWNLPELTAIAFAGFAAVIGYQDIWASTYGIGRTLSPLFIALAAIAFRDRRFVFALPLLLAVPRIALQFAAELKVALLAG